MQVDLNRSETDIAKTQYGFLVKLLKTAYETGERNNVLISPIGAAMVAGMIANAIDEADRVELLRALNINLSDLETYNCYARKMLKGLPTLDKSTLLTIDNGMWLSMPE